MVRITPAGILEINRLIFSEPSVSAVVTPIASETNESSEATSVRITCVVLSNVQSPPGVTVGASTTPFRKTSKVFSADSAVSLPVAGAIPSCVDSVETACALNSNFPVSELTCAAGNKPTSPASTSAPCT